MVIEKCSGAVDLLSTEFFPQFLYNIAVIKNIIPTRLLICLKTWFIFYLEIRMQPKSLFTAFLKK